MCRNLNSWTRGASKPSLVRAHSQAGALTVCGYHRQSDAQSGTRRHARTAAVLMAAGSNQAAIGQAAGRTTPSLLCTVVVTRRRRRVASFAFPPGDAPTGASSESTDNAAARSRHHSAQSAVNRGRIQLGHFFSRPLDSSHSLLTASFKLSEPLCVSLPGSLALRCTPGPWRKGPSRKQDFVIRNQGTFCPNERHPGLPRNPEPTTITYATRLSGAASPGSAGLEV